MTWSRSDRAPHAAPHLVRSGAVLLTGLLLTACGGASKDPAPGSVGLSSNQSPVAVVASDATSTDTATEPAAASASATTVAGPGALGALTGPYGSGDYGHLHITIMKATLTNLAFDEWGKAGVIAGDPDARYLYVTLQVANKDPNDQVGFADQGLTLVAGTPVSAERVNRNGDFTQWVKAQDTSEREFGFTLLGNVPPDQLALRYSTQTVPVTIPVLAAAVPATPYPITLKPPAPLSFTGSNVATCPVTWTLAADSASVTLDLPKELRNREGATVSNRAAAGTRWLVVNGVITTGPVKGSNGCSGTDQGNLTEGSFRLVVDGRPFAPVVAPLEIIRSRQSMKIQVIWPLPADTTGPVKLRGLGTHGSQADAAFTLAAMPALPGEAG